MYTTPDEIKARYPLLTSLGDALVTSHHILMAEAEINGLLSSGFTVPFSDNVLTVKDLTQQLVYLRAANSKVADAEKMYVTWLERVERIRGGGEALVTTSGDLLNSTAGGITSTTDDYRPTFGMRDYSEQSIDSQLLDDEANL